MTSRSPDNPNIICSVDEKTCERCLLPARIHSAREQQVFPSNPPVCLSPIDKSSIGYKESAKNIAMTLDMMRKVEYTDLI